MNAQIQKLADKAGLFVDLGGESWPRAMAAEESVIVYQKFAELIVQECLDTIQRGIDNGGGANEDIVLAGKLALFYAYRNIQYRFGIGDYKDQEHFGVEE